MYTTKKKTTEQFINEAEDVHNGEYDYSKVEYVNNVTPVCIICQEHGEFWQTPKQHLRGQGCPECGRKKNKKKRGDREKTDSTRRKLLKEKTGNGGGKFTTDLFVDFLKEKYGDKYDYSKVNYVNIKTPVCVVCKKHGDFWKTPLKLLHRNTGCPECILEKKKSKLALGKETFVEKANKIHHWKYSYENVVYKNNSTKVEITCPKHGPFLCTPQNHLHGRGCPICKSEIYVYEERLYNFLKSFIDESEIIRQYRCDWLSNGKSLDFYLPKYRIAIEHQGSQHYRLTRFEWDNEDRLQRQINNDKEKYEECLENGVNLFYFTYEMKEKPENCFHDLLFLEEDLKNKIINSIH